MRDVRIQKVLAEQGVCSRRAAEQLIREGRVKLNGRPVTVGDQNGHAERPAHGRRTEGLCAEEVGEILLYDV